MAAELVGMIANWKRTEAIQVFVFTSSEKEQWTGENSTVCTTLVNSFKSHLQRMWIKDRMNLCSSDRLVTVRRMYQDEFVLGLPIPSPSHPLPSLPLEVGPLNQARRSGGALWNCEPLSGRGLVNKINTKQTNEQSLQISNKSAIMHGTVSHGMACKVDRRLNAGYYMFTVGGVA